MRFDIFYVPKRFEHVHIGDVIDYDIGRKGQVISINHGKDRDGIMSLKIMELKHRRRRRYRRRKRWNHRKRR